MIGINLFILAPILFLLHTHTHTHTHTSTYLLTALIFGYKKRKCKNDKEPKSKQVDVFKSIKIKISRKGKVIKVFDLYFFCRESWKSLLILGQIKLTTFKALSLSLSLSFTTFIINLMLWIILFSFWVNKIEKKQFNFWGKNWKISWNCCSEVAIETLRNENNGKAYKARCTGCLFITLFDHLDDKRKMSGQYELVL